ncbi:MAG: metalloregulator ArsR/SmtB family transcription factor [Nitrospinota bacterium]
MKCVGPTLSKKDLSRLKEKLVFNPELDELSVYFGLMSSSSRLKIIYLLHGVKEACVCDMAEILDITVSAVSQHLSKFKAYGLVKARRENQTLYYSLMDKENLNNLYKYFDDLKE